MTVMGVLSASDMADINSREAAFAVGWRSEGGEEGEKSSGG